jgi:aspartate beta-hydroxylase
MALVDAHRREVCERLLAPWVQRFGPEAMARVRSFVAVQLGEASYTPADTRQRPTAMPFPGLPQTPYLDKRRMAGISELEAQTPAILAELHALLGELAGREKVFDDPALAQAFLRGSRGAAAWNGYYFYRHGQRNETNATRCPATMEAIDRLELARVRGHGPEVVFSTLGPGTHLLPHHGVTNTRVVCHLPLIVPPDCALRVADEEHHWRVGEVVAFDDTYAHEAWNRSDEVRVVMIFDLWHPDLTAAERLAVADLQAALGDFAGPAAHGEA